MNEFLSVVPNQAWLRKVSGVFLSMGGDKRPRESPWSLIHVSTPNASVAMSW
jgi:hypothetical protein